VTLSPAVASDLGIAYEETGGVVVLQLKPDSMATFSGLLPGDVILKVNDQEITNVDQLIRNLIRTRKGWEITFKRGSKVLVQTW
jgi:S1-C subfamily serine protease